MEIVEITRTSYATLSHAGFLSFMQSVEWAVFKESSSNYKAKFYDVNHNGSNIGQFQLLTREFFGVFKVAYAPRVMFIFADKFNESEFEECLKKLGYHLILWESDPGYENLKVLDQIGFETSIELQPKATIVKDLKVDDLMNSIPSKPIFFARSQSSK